MDVETARTMPTATPFEQQTRPFHLMAKPSGARCNIDCQYCFFLSKEKLYPNSRFRMPDEVMDAYIRQTLESQPDGEVNIAWQGGEPTLMGLDFYRKAVVLAARYARKGQSVRHSIQTNGILLTDEWCAFLKEHDFLVGISMDGPKELHDAYRVDRMGRGTFDSVLAAYRRLQAHGVEHNILCTLHAANAARPLDVYRFFRDELQADWMQFIPIVEKQAGPDGRVVPSARTVNATAYGRFLCAIFDEWVRRDVGSVFVQDLEVALRSWMGLHPGLCIRAETCGDALVLEHTGDVYSCDHFVEPEHLVGNLMETPLLQIVNSPPQAAFGMAKRDTLPAFCRNCDVRFACNGGCPKDRFLTAPDGEPGLNYLCDGFRLFFRHIDGPMRLMAALLRQGRSAVEVMDQLPGAPAAAMPCPGRNDPCPCGSGRKYKKCHGG
jgi:uncharacterized protein